MEKIIKNFMDSGIKKNSKIDFFEPDPVIENSSVTAKRIRDLIIELDELVSRGIIRTKFPYIEIKYRKVIFETKIEITVYWQNPNEYQSIYKTKKFSEDLLKAIGQCNSIKILARSRGVMIEDDDEKVEKVASLSPKRKWGGLSCLIGGE